MGKLVDVNGAAIPTKEEQEGLQKMADLMTAIDQLFIEREVDLNEACSAAVNIFTRAYSKIPQQSEQSFIENTMRALAQAFGMLTVQKRNVEKAARLAVNEMKQFIKPN